MQFLKISPDDKREAKVWKLYEDSFAPSERRKRKDHLRACKDSHFFPISIWGGDVFIGLAYYWKWSEYLYLEYFAIAPEQREKGKGTEIFQQICKSGRIVVGEIDPRGEDLNRRIHFYGKEGCKMTPYMLKHLPYRKNADRFDLMIISYPEVINESQYSEFVQFLHGTVGKYCEGCQ